MKKKYYIRKNSPLWRLGQLAMFTALMFIAWGYAFGVQTIKEFLLGLL